MYIPIVVKYVCKSKTLRLILGFSEHFKRWEKKRTCTFDNHCYVLAICSTILCVYRFQNLRENEKKFFFKTSFWYLCTRKLKFNSNSSTRIFDTIIRISYVWGSKIKFVLRKKKCDLFRCTFRGFKLEIPFLTTVSYKVMNLGVEVYPSTSLSMPVIRCFSWL